MIHARENDFDAVKDIFKQHKEWFPHIRQDYLKRMIASGNLILGVVDKIHIDSDVYTDDKIDPVKLDPVSRMGYNYYSRANKGLFTINKPKGLCVGIDSLPGFIKNSNEFTG